MTERYLKTLSRQQKLCAYLSTEFECSDKIEDDGDKLLVKKAQIKTIHFYKLYQIPYAAGLVLFAMRNMSTTSRPLPIRLLISGICFSSLYFKHYVGEYGIQRNVDKIFEIVTSNEHLRRRS